jgi:cytochrome d ubiquinol oxidase subunit I
MGRQPWVVAPNPTGVDMVRMLTQDGVSVVVGTGQVVLSLATYTAVYTALGIVWFTLIRRYARVGAPQVTGAVAHAPLTDERQLSFAY